MTCKDRTNEFRAVAEAMAKRNPFVVKPQVTKKTLIKNQISSNTLAAEISREIAETTEKMKELSKLAKTRTPFGDPTHRIDEITCDIKEDISRLQHKIENLGQFVLNQKTPNKSASQHSSTIVTALNSTLMSTTKQFAEVLEIRTQNLKSHQERRQKVTGNHHMIQKPMFQPAFDMFDGDGGFAQQDGDVIIPVPLMQVYDDNTSLILQRVDQAKEIEEEMRKIHTIFSKLAEYVQSQGEQIRRIEDRIDETLVNSEYAHQKLLEAYNNLANDRKTMLKGFGILLFFVFVFVMFFI